MRINTLDKETFELSDDENKQIARLVYNSSTFNEAVLEIPDRFSLQLIATGTWITIFNTGQTEKVMAKIKVETGGVMIVRRFYKRIKYIFKRSVNWKLRFVLANKDGDEVLSLLPVVNWEKRSHDFILQLNEEFEKECDSFLILQALHCANCSLSMMGDGRVPALISV